MSGVCRDGHGKARPAIVGPGKVHPALLVGAALLAMLAQGVEAQSRARPNRDVIVSAAVSLSDVLQQLASIYEARSGARVDLFISADEAQMDRAAGEVVPGSRVDLLSNQLAIAVPDDRARQFTSARELADPAIMRSAIGDPAAVPAGVYAR